MTGLARTLVEVDEIYPLIISKFCSGYIEISRFLVLIIVLRNRTAVCDGAFKILKFYLHGCKWTLCHNRNQIAEETIQTP